jgi:PmbA protein
MSDIIDRAGLEDAASRLVAAALKAGADAADALADKSVSQNVQVRLGKREDVTRSERDGFGLRVFVGDRSATIGVSSLSDPAILAERAVAMARVATPDPYAGLAPADRLAKTFPDLDLFDPSAPPSADELAEDALATEDAARAVAGVSNSNGASAYWSFGAGAMATSHGFLASAQSSRHGRSVSVLAGEGTGMERDYEVASKRYRADLETPEWVGESAGTRAVKRLGGRKLDTTAGVVVFDVRIAAGLLGHLISGISGSAIARKTSFLKDKLGQRILPAGMTITDDPFIPRGLASRAFDGEGLVGDVLKLVDDGVLMTWLLDSASARELGLESNARAGRGLGSPHPGPTNVTMSPGPVTRDELLKQIGTGFYVTDLIGHGVNGLTGDYSRGASGFWIENGELTYPVTEMTIAGNLLDMFPRFLPANDVETRFSYQAPTIAIEGMTIAGR